jgi:hypothetical protein
MSEMHPTVKPTVVEEEEEEEEEGPEAEDVRPVDQFRAQESFVRL